MSINKDIKSLFPIFKRQINGKPLVFLDSAASAQKPQSVIDAMSDEISNHYANINRGVYTLSEESTEKVESVRDKIANFIHAEDPNEIIFTKNATESINLVAYSWGRSNLKQGDVVVISEMEHHSNIVPWQILRDEIGFELRYIGVTDDGYLNWIDFRDNVDEDDLDKIKLISVTHVSNVLGTVNHIREIADWAHANDVLLLVDGAQGVTQLPVSVLELGADFYVFSGHKLYGPTGVGVLYGKKNILNKMKPFLAGGDMILEVKKDHSTYQDIPHKFEAGTPPIIEIIGLGAAIDFINSIGLDSIREHMFELLNYTFPKLSSINKVKVYGPTSMENKCGVIAFTISGVHPHDIASILDSEGIAIRSGHHCAQPLCDRFGQSAMARISFGIYNDHSDIDALISGLDTVKRVFKL
jgi:cysteine desulfurase / selenocysteine lyase